MSIRLKLPKTITGLVAAGCLLAAMPLIAAVVFANIALGRLTHQTEALLDHGILSTQLGMQLRDRLFDLERSARQHLVLHDPRMVELTERRWQDAAETVQQLRTAPAQTPVSFAIGAEFDQERLRWQASAGVEAERLAVVERLHALLPKADAMIAASREDTEVQMRRLRADTLRARRQMLFCALTLIPLGGLLAWGFSVAVTRPVKQMFRTIAALGHGRYTRGETIEFPRELRRLGEQIEWLRQRLARLEEDKERFLRQVSHELKTPLATLREGTELLREGALGELSQRQGEVAAILCESTSELESLIENLLAYSEWRAGRQEAQKSWFDTHTFIDEVLAVHRLPFKQRALQLELELRVPRLFALRNPMRVAVDNLISNAIKHSPVGGRIRITVSAQHGYYQLSVRDHGRGVAAAEKETIFEPFIRGSESEEQGIRGTGIGLSIVHETLLAHGGSVIVEDAEPGARFLLRWPDPGPEPAEQRLHAAGADAGASA